MGERCIFQQSVKRIFIGTLSRFQMPVSKTQDNHNQEEDIGVFVYYAKQS